MASPAKRTCPKCGTTDVEKEYYLGADTGDFVCRLCGFAAPRHSEVWYKKATPDPNELAARIVDEATGEAPEELPSDKNPHAVALGRLGGMKGGKARAKKLTPEQRQEIARKAAEARWLKRP